MSEKPDLINSKEDIIIEFKDVHKSFEDKKVLDGLNLKIRRGETLTIIGRSGSGKSVLLKLLMGIMEVDSGQILVDGEDITSIPEHRKIEIRKKFGMLFQSAALFDSMSVWENVAYPLIEHTKMKMDDIMKKVKEKLALVDMQGTEYLMPAELSGGMKKRVGLARAIAFDPKVILYDEPTTGLDPITANTINNLIIRLQKLLKVTSLVVTHDLQSAYKITDRIAMLHKGKIHLVGTVEEIKNSPSKLVHQFITGGEDGFES